MWAGRASQSSSWVSDSVGCETSWTTKDEGGGDEVETIRDNTTIASDEEREAGSPTTMSSFAAEKSEAIEQCLPPLSYQKLDGSWVCLPYKIEKLERELFSNSPGSGRRTAIIETLRQSKIYHVTPCSVTCAFFWL
jgi:hypothetical protein